MHALKRWTRRMALKALGLTARDDDSPTSVDGHTVADVLDGASRSLPTLRAAPGTARPNGFGTLIGLVREAGLEGILKTDNSGEGWTLFAPTDDAFAALSDMPSGQALVNLLTYHLVGEPLQSRHLSDGQVVTTVEGSTFEVNEEGSNVTLTDQGGNTVTVLHRDVPADNGVVHVIDQVLSSTC